MPEEIRHASILLTEEQLTRLIVVLNNALVAKGCVRKSWVPDINNIMEKAVNGIISLQDRERKPLEIK